MGDRRSPSVCHPPQYVSACCQAGAEEGREVHLMRLLAEPTKARPRGGCTCHKTCRIPDSHIEIRDLYHGVYLLRRLVSPPPCGPQQREEAIWDILSSLRNCLHRWGYTATPKENTQGVAAESWSRPRRREDPHDEAL